MKPFDPTTTFEAPHPPVGAVSPPCPVCRSASTISTSGAADAEGYWRCTACGEVWNPRRRTSQPGTNRWR